MKNEDSEKLINVHKLFDPALSNAVHLINVE